MATNPFTPEGIPTYMLDTPNAQMPNPQDSASLAMFTPQTGFSDSGAGSQTANIAAALAGNETMLEANDSPGTPD
jgi:hypothetical protein